MSLFKKCKKGNLKNTNLVAEELISLPFHARLSNNDIKKVCDKIRLFLNE